MNEARPLSDLAGKRSLSTYTERQLRREIERLRDERDEQASIISTFESERDEMQKAITRLKSDHTKREADFRETQRRIAQLEKSLTQYAELVAVKQNVIERVKEQLKEKIIEADQVSVELRTANMEIQEVKDGKRRLFAEVKELKRTIVVMKGKIALVENAGCLDDQPDLEVPRSQTDAQQHLNEKEQMQAQHMEEVEKLLAEIEKLKSDRDHANDNHAQVRSPTSLHTLEA
jgi:chromosome segregation ATPase